MHDARAEAPLRKILKRSATGLFAARLSGAAFLALTVAPAALAADEPILLDPVVLENQEDATGPVRGSNNPPTVTGSKIPILASEVPQSLSVLGREDLERFNADRVSEALRYTAGVTADVFGDDNDYDWLRIRGFQADQTGVFLDNAQNLSFAFGSFFIDPYALERVEVLRGPSSSLYGGSNPGGIVNYVSKRPGGRVREVVVGGDDAPSGFVAFDYGDDFGPGQAYRVTGRLKGGDQYDDFNDGLRGTLAPGVKFTVGDATEVTLLANIHIADEQHNGSTFLPYAGTVVPTAQFGFIDDDANFSDPDWDSYSREQFSATAIVETPFDNGFTFTGIARVGQASVEERYFYPFGYAGFATTPQDAQGTLSLIAFEHDTLVRTAQTDLRYYGAVETGALTHDLLFGIDARYYWLDETQASGFGTNQVVNPVAPGTPVLGAPYQDAVTQQSQIGFYFQDQIRYGGWILTGNIRHDFVDTDQNGASGFDRNDSEFSWRVGLSHEFEGGFTPYVSYSSYFNPLITSPANGVTGSETGDQIEAGFKWAPPGENYSLTAAVFRIDRTNVVTGVFPSFNQLGEVRVDGFEVEGEYDFLNGLTVAGSATVLDAEVRADADPTLVGTTPTLIPETEISARAEYDFDGPLDGLTIGAGVRFRGESFANAANSLVVPSSTVFDLYGGYEVVEGVRVSVSATNIADNRYVTGCQTEYVCSYGSGREIGLAISATW